MREHMMERSPLQVLPHVSFPKPFGFRLNLISAVYTESESDFDSATFIRAYIMIRTNIGFFKTFHIKKEEQFSIEIYTTNER
jgi:hypothetical protein